MKKQFIKDEKDAGKIYLLTNQTRVKCHMWARGRESMYGEIIDSYPKISVYVPIDYIVREIKTDEIN